MDYDNMRLSLFGQFETVQALLPKDSLLKLFMADSTTYVLTAYKNNRYMWHDLATTQDELEVLKHNAENAGYTYVIELQD